MVEQLQAFVDDSKAREDVLVLAGYIANLDQWKCFSIEWDALLKEPTPWDEFKMKVAARHPQRSEKFYRLVEKYALAYIACIVEIEPLRRVCAELGIDRAGLGNPFLTNPYNLAFKLIMDATYRELARVRLNGSLEFIFDDRGEEKHVRNAWEFFLLGLSEDARRRVAAEPKFEKSHEVLPLQAAEIIAWHARKHWIKHRKFEGDVELSWPVQRPVLGHLVHWDYEEIKSQLVRVRELLQNGVILMPHSQ
jgi:hypothetical protein